MKKNNRRLMDYLVAFVLSGIVCVNCLSPTISLVSIDSEAILQIIREILCPPEAPSQPTEHPSKKVPSAKKKNKQTVAQPQKTKTEVDISQFVQEIPSENSVSKTPSPVDNRSKDAADTSSTTKTGKLNLEVENDAALVFIGNTTKQAQIEIVNNETEENSSQTFHYSDVCNTPEATKPLSYIPLKTGEYDISLYDCDLTLIHEIYLIHDLNSILEDAQNTEAEASESIAETYPTPAAEPTPDSTLPPPPESVPSPDPETLNLLEQNKQYTINTNQLNSYILFSYYTEDTFIPYFKMDSENPCCVEIEIYHMDNPEVLISKNRLELDRLSYVYYPDKEALDAENTYLIKVTINNSTTPQNEISFYMEESRE